MRMRKIPSNRPPAAGPPGRRPRRWPWPVAGLVTACLITACTSAAGTSTAAASASPVTASAASNAAEPVDCAPPGVKQPPCYSPEAYQVAYGVTPLLGHGTNGSGETVVMPEPAETSSGGGATDIRQDLAAFDKTFALPTASLHVVNTIAKSAAPYLAGDEEVTDTETVHAIAPGASLDVVLVPAGTIASPAGIAAAITTVIREGVALHAAVVSISVSVGEHFLTRAEAAAMNAALEQAREQDVTVVASSGDYGAVSSHPAGPPVQVSVPASDPLVLGVGGTSLDATPGGTYLGEMAWNADTEASGGGYSSIFPRPAYQDGLGRPGATRGVPDVAANADSSTAMALEYGDGQFRPAPGTSASAPLWAGVVALADQQAGHPIGFINPAIYDIARSPAYHRAFHDVVTGDNSVIWPTGIFVGYNAGPGWDPVTGWGSPDAQYLVPLLASTAPSGT
jgi:subtilase family serine protease